MNRNSPGKDRLRLALPLLFFVSGALGLVYEVLWMRWFTALFGASLGFALQTRRRWLRILAPIAGLALAIAAHMLNNALPLFAALTEIAEAADALSKDVEKTPRRVVSASVICNANLLLELIRVARTFARPQP